MPQIVINQDMGDYVKYAKKKAREEAQKTLAIIVIGIGFLLYIGYTLWGLVHS